MRRARDGLPARVSGPWTREKLTYVEKYASAFMKAMAPKRNAGKWAELVYLDLLAGPGRGIDRDSGAEFDGSPLRVLKITPAFDRLFFADLSPRNVEALRRRISTADLSRVDLRVGDCNVVAKEVVAQLLPRTLGLAFVDPQGFEATFRLFQVLATRRIDVLFLFPSGIGIARNLAQPRGCLESRPAVGLGIQDEDGKERLPVSGRGRSLLHEREERADVPPAVLLSGPRRADPLARYQEDRTERPAHAPALSLGACPPGTCQGNVPSPKPL